MADVQTDESKFHTDGWMVTGSLMDWLSGHTDGHLVTDSLTDW